MSTSNFVPIQPAGDAPQPGGNSRPSKRKRENTRQACQNCRQSKGKCDGLRPVCGPCTERGRDCEYEYSQEGVPRQSAMRARLDSLEALFKQLRQATAPKAQRLFEKLRANADVQILLQNLDFEGGDDNEADGKDDEVMAAKGQERQLSELAATRPILPGRSTSSISDQTRSGPVALRDGGTPHEPLQRLSWNIEVPTAPLTRAAVDNFFACAGTLLHVFSRAQADSLHDEVFGNGPQDSSWRASVCCLCALASIGKAYDHSSDASASSRRYYEVSKSLFEDLLEARSLDGIKVCTLLSLYNIFDKATLALVHIEVGMSLARYYGLEHRQKLVDMPTSTWIDYRKSWRTLLFFKSWLCFTLGYMAGDDILAGDRIKLEDLEIKNGEDGMEDMIQTETAKISLLKAKILRLDLVFNHVTAGTVQTVSQELEDWLAHLPKPMRIEALSQGHDESDDFRRSIYYIHLLFQGARMLLYRRILSQHARQKSELAAHHQSVLDSATMLQALRDGRHVANMTSHTLKILQDENGIFKRCWLVIFQAFTAGTLILYEAAQKQLHRFPEEFWRKDLALAEWPLSTLKFCGELDPVALKFHKALVPYHNDMAMLNPSLPTSPSAMVCDEDNPYYAQYLCQIPEGDTQMVERSLALRQLLCRPFGEPQKRPNHLEIEHLDWHLGSSIPFHWEQNFEPSSKELKEQVDITQPTNVFLDSTRPAGWASPPPGSQIWE